MSWALPEFKTRFPHPVLEAGADPYVVLHDHHVYYIHVIDDRAIYIRKAAKLDELAAAEPVQVWPKPGDPLRESLWAPELHLLDGRWYIYFADGPRDALYTSQRMYVVVGDGDDPQTAQYELIGKVATPSDQWAIDGTVLTMADERRYFVWSGWATQTDMNQNLYIAAMVNPWTLAGERVKISSPIFDWERHGPVAVNEGPQVLPQGTARHIIFSASHSTTDQYCLGELSLIGADPLDPTHWVKHPEPVFQTHDDLISPGHASFLLTEDETRGWMIFHTARSRHSGWDRQIRLESFTLSASGVPQFASAAIGRPQPPP